MMRSILLFFVILLALVLGGCGKVDPTPLTKEQFREMYTNINNFKGRSVDIYGEIFATPQRLDKMVYLQLYADPINQEQSIIVAYNDPSLDVQNGDFIHVVGKVKDAFKGENTFGNKLLVPRIVAGTVVKVDPATALSPP